MANFHKTQKESDIGFIFRVVLLTCLAESDVRTSRLFVGKNSTTEVAINHTDDVIPNTVDQWPRIVQ